MKGRSLIIFTGVVAVAIVAWVMKPQSRPMRLADGTSIELSGLKFGISNVFIHGSRLERWFGSLLPTNALLKRPQRSNQLQFKQPVLSAAFRISGVPVENGTSRILAPKFHPQFRLVITGADPFPYVEDFVRTMRYQDGVFLYVNATSFPRSSPVLHFQIQQHDDKLGPWRTVAEFHRPNPATDAERDWSPEPFPVRQTVKDVGLVLEAVTVSPRYSDQWIYFWQTTVDIGFQIKVGGVLQTNWTLHQVNGDDASGNSLFLGGTREFENGRSVYRAFRSLDPRRVWHLWMELAPQSGFEPEELFTFEVPTPPSRSFITNIGVHRLMVQWSKADMLSVELWGNLGGRRLMFIDAQDAQGHSITNQSSAGDRVRFWWKAAKLPEPLPPLKSSTIRVTIAITRNIPMQVTVQPRLIESGR